MKRMSALAAILKEADDASGIHPPFHSYHEGYALILEEIDELWEEIKTKVKIPNMIRNEAVHAGAMILRFLTDLCEE